MRRWRMILVGGLVLLGAQAVISSAFAFGILSMDAGSGPTWPIVVAIAASVVALVCLLGLGVLAIRWWND